MTPLLVSNSDGGGGAARAATRLHRALLGQGIHARMRVRHKTGDEPSAEGSGNWHGKLADRLRLPMGDLYKRLQRTTNTAPHSANRMPSRWARLLDTSNADVINLHWLGDETMSIADIGRIRKPIVWTLHDMWPFCGTEHYADDSPTARWRRGYTADNRNPADTGIDLDRLAWHDKRQAWRRPMLLVAPSNWLAACARGSALMSGWPLTVIPNALDTGLYKPLDRTFCRHALDLPQDGRLILFGALGGGQDPRKGYDLLLGALARLRLQTMQEKVTCVAFGASQPSPPPELPLPVRWLGRIQDDFSLALLYNAADVTVVPSRQENLPQVATEAQACGCPVLAFDCTGLPDAVLHRHTGYLARPYDPDDLAEGLRWLLDDEDRRRSLGVAARQRAVLLWHPDIVAKQYLEVYRQAVDSLPTNG
ncbi:glycosyltransferase [Azospira restricta]|uniref:Glycosyltransferase n=1 Tax=Azospira restricta TaxID=404405 RepID=A0A974PYG0_9RHOO|nr:glycosyltransferase [Azospira restricta]QRJ63601.1 glycosyltransferase [Azospira restricta]